MEKWLFNQLTVEKTKDGWKPLRFTEGQLKQYGKREVHGLRSYCPAGVGLALLTDAKWLRLSYTILDKIRDFAYFDLLVDGIMVSSFEHLPVSLGTHVSTFLLPEHGGMRSVTIYLPQTVQLVLHDLQLSSGAVVETVEARPKRLLCLGDSITQGMDSLHPSNTYPVLLSNFLNMQLLNQGVGGYFFNADSLDVSLPYHPELITVAYGTNDWSRCRTIAEFREHCANYMRMLVFLYPEARIFTMTPIWRRDMHEQKGTFSFLEINQAIAGVCSFFPNVRVIDGLSLVPHVPSLFDAGGVHPTDEGFLHLALNLLKIIQK
ncbi:SGNH/GDSL hydrolase family protein [Paenibacillus sp. FSL H8-0034]|uniref:SGNH/GDSL hydrolase family protein n=1 Tax=Paenibacillus sp. FSL H8-0034 TaxID=2954671 RepID=UPI0030FAD3D5